MDQFIGLIIFALVAALADWAKKRAQKNAQHEDSESIPIPPTIPKSNWENQLKRYIEEHSNLPKRTPKPIRPVLVSRPPNLPLMPPARSPVPVEESEGDLRFKNPLTVSQASYARASSLKDHVARRMEAIRSETSTHVHKTTAKPAPTHVLIGHLTARDAMLATIILGKPKALSEN